MAQPESFKAKRINFKAQTLKMRGGPHDSEFFKCYSQYLEETISQILGDQITFEST
jgi:hypothetical protein